MMSTQTVLLSVVRVLQLAHDRELVVIPLLLIAFALCAAYAFVAGRRMYHRYVARRAIVTVAVVAPWLPAAEVEVLLEAAKQSMVSAGATVLRTASALDICSAARPQALVASDTGAGSESDAVRTDERVTFAVAVLRTAIALEHTALVLAAESVKAQAWKRDALQVRGRGGIIGRDAGGELDEARQTIVLCNGGVLDAEALCTTQAMWTRLWHRTGWRRAALRTRYDAVVVITSGGPSTSGDSSAVPTAEVQQGIRPSRRTVSWAAHANAALVAVRSTDEVTHAVSTAVLDVARKRTVKALPQKHKKLS